MIEARVFIDDIEHIRTILEHQNALLKGRYKIIDTVYENRDLSVSLTDEFLRLRVIPENIWDEKAVIVALKQTITREVGKLSTIPLKREFDSKSEAEEYIHHRFATEYKESFSFSRVGWQYVTKNGDVVDLEIIENGYPSVEFKSETDKGLATLLQSFGIDPTEVLRGPSVVATKKLLNF